MVKSSSKGGEEVTELQADMRSMAGSLTEIKQQLTDLQVDLKNLVQTINQHHTEKEVMKEKTEALDSRVKSCEEGIRVLRKNQGIIERNNSNFMTTIKTYGSIAAVVIPAGITLLINLL